MSKIVAARPNQYGTGAGARENPQKSEFRITSVYGYSEMIPRFSPRETA
jgi:hypothetical protein